MSAAAIITVRQHKAIAYLRDNNAIDKSSAVPRQSIPYIHQWYVRRLEKKGVIVTENGMSYLDVQKWRQLRSYKLLFALVLIALAVLLLFALGSFG